MSFQWGRRCNVKQYADTVEPRLFVNVWGGILRRVPFFVPLLVRSLFYLFFWTHACRQARLDRLRGYACLGEPGRVLIDASTSGYVVNVMGMVDVMSKVLLATLMPLARRRKGSRVTPVLCKTLLTRARERGNVNIGTRAYNLAHDIVFEGGYAMVLAAVQAEFGPIESTCRVCGCCLCFRDSPAVPEMFVTC